MHGSFGPDAAIAQLPAETSSFVGRKRELAELLELVSRARLVTLTGPGGCGKTRLALRLASTLAVTYAGEVGWVELAPLADPALVPRAVAVVLGVREQPGRALLETLTAALRPRRLLLVLDNCEHLVDGSAELAAQLLRACAELRIVTTSREALDIAGEVLWRVPPLAFPEAEAAASASQVGGYEAVRLFTERARAVRQEFTLTDANAAAVAQICRQLDGSPLALELAAARVPVLAPEQLAARLGDRFRLLAAGERTAVPRQRTLRATIDWSHDLLTEPERALFRRLAAFAGGWTLEAAEAVCVDDAVEADQVLALLARLVDKSLVVSEERGGEARFRLLETIRAYARERLGERGEADSVQQRHAAYCLTLAERAAPYLNGPDRRAWLERLEREHDNMRSALRWATHTAAVETALRLSAALWWFWFHRGDWREGREWLEAALSFCDDPAPAAARAPALLGAGMLAFAQGDHPIAQSRLSESATLYEQVGDQVGRAHALAFLVMPLVHQGDSAGARPIAEESVDVLRRADHRWGLAVALTNLGIVAEAQRDFSRAAPLYEESAALFRNLGDTWGLSLPLRHLGYVVAGQGDFRQAAALFRESLALCRELGDQWFSSMGLEDLAGVASLEGEHRRAAVLLGAAETLREEIGAALRPLYRDGYDQTLADARNGLGEAAFAAAWAEGRGMGSERALAYALGELDLRNSKRVAGPLSPREREVAVLVARGLTNRQIADALVITEKTVEAHVGSVLRKLTLGSRSQLAVWVHQQGLLAPTTAER